MIACTGLGFQENILGPAAPKFSDLVTRKIISVKTRKVGRQ